MSAAAPGTQRPRDGDRGRWAPGERHVLLDARGFTPVFASKAVSSVGSAVVWVVLPLYVYQVTGSPTLTGFVSTLNVLPYIAFGLFAGAMVDRVSPRRTMVLMEACNAAVIFGVPLLLAFGDVPVTVLCAIAFVSSSCYVWFDVASTAAVPAIVGRRRLIDANGMLWTTTTVAAAVAAPLGFFLLNDAGLGLTFVLVGSTYAVSALALTAVRDRAPADGPAEETSDAPDAAGQEPGYATGVWAGLRFIAGNRAIRLLTAMSAGTGLSGGAVYGMIVVFADGSLGLAPDDARISIVIAASSAGAFAASLLVGRLKKRDVSVVVRVLLALDVVLMAAYALSSHWLWAAPLLGLWNLAHTCVMIVSVSLRQMFCPPGLQGRVNATGRIIALGCVPLGSALCGIATGALGVRGATLLLAVPALASFLMAVSMARRDLPAATS